MNLVKWIRKNQTKIMTFVVIVLMIVFVGGYSLKQILRSMQIGGEPTLATFGESGELKPSHRNVAQAELNVLRAMRMNFLLASQKDTKSQLLGLLLFPGGRMETYLNNQLKKAAQQGSIAMTVQQIDDFFLNVREQSDIYWLLLNYEAKKAGIRISNEDVKSMLKNVIPMLTNGQADAAQLVRAVVEQSNVPEERIFHTIGKLLAVVTYIGMVSDTEAATINEIRNRAAFMNEKINSEYVEFEAQDFISQTDEPSEQELLSQLKRFNDNQPGNITKQNHYGFGYLLPPRAQIEYAVIRMDEIQDMISEVTPEDMENFYTNNLERFRYEKKLDPNDPQSETTTITKPYSEVSEQIKSTIRANRVNSRAEIIISDLQERLEKNFIDIYVRQATSEQLKEKSRSYKEAIQETEKKYDIDIYYGKTGWLDRQRLANDPVFGRMGMKGRSGATMVPLEKIIFSVEPIKETIMGKYEVSQPKLWENIGPVMGVVQTENNSGFSQVIGLMRITGAKEKQIPKKIDLSYDITGGKISKTVGNENNRDYYSLRQKVYDDWKILGAMEKAHNAADNLANIVTAKGWEKGLEEFNEKYDQAKFDITKMNERARISQTQIEILKDRAGPEYIKNMVHDKMLLDKLYSLIPMDEYETINPLKAIKVEPQAKCYLVKSVTKTPVYRSDYLESKPAMASTFAYRAQNTAAIELLNPKNIFERLNFQIVTQERESEDSTEDKQNIENENGNEGQNSSEQNSN
jgi:hypothetical protein